ncbi:MAG: hypothetical protein L0I24_25995, partial [Pseudonocardia sp.]|nr:hypothetical protein [Pseudonocardia sp.]
MSARTDGVPWEIDPLRLRFRTGSRPPLGRLLRSVPRPLALSPAWIPAVDVVARRVLPGVRSRGSSVIVGRGCGHDRRFGTRRRSWARRRFPDVDLQAADRRRQTAA